MRQHRSVLPQTPAPMLDQLDYSGALAVPDTEPWWLAVNQIVNEAELETIQGARNKLMNTNLCIAAVGAGEGIDLIRTKLKQAREYALTHYRAGKISAG